MKKLFIYKIVPSYERDINKIVTFGKRSKIYVNYR